MVIVYFQTPNKLYSEIAAVFADEDLYLKCLAGLVKKAKASRMIVTESCGLSTEQVIEALKTLNKIHYANSK